MIYTDKKDAMPKPSKEICVTRLLNIIIIKGNIFRNSYIIGKNSLHELLKLSQYF